MQYSSILIPILTIVAIGNAPLVASEEFDLVIVGGRVIDPETKFDAVRNVGIRNGRIAAITDEAIVGRETIDASGHVVAPGFLDMHFHNTGIPFGTKLGLRDGVTTTMELEAGAYPVDEWYAATAGRSQTNYAVSVSVPAIRERIHNPEYKAVFSGDFVYDVLAAPKPSRTSMKWSTAVSSPEQIEQFGKMLDEGLAQGALGVGYAVGYMVDGASQKESILCQKLAGKYGRSVFVHGRYSSQRPPTSGLLGFFELLGPQQIYGGAIVFQHLHAQALNETALALRMIDEARSKGRPVLAEIYPYNYGATIIGADYLRPDNYGPNMGRSYEDIIETASLEPLTKERYESLLKTAPTTSVLFYNATEQTTYDALAHSSTVLGSDAFPYTNRKTGEIALDWDTPYDAVVGHPRGAGTHARLLRLVREKKVDVPLPVAVSKMTYMIARFLEDNGVPAMAKKGRLQVGMDADVTIFDPATVRDNATMQQGGLPSTGIPHVVVNGTVVVKDSRVRKGIFPGKPVYAKSK